MRLDRLEISGFMRFKGPAVLDLRELPPGLVAILGANGEGKTRMLDGALAGLYGPGMQRDAFPSREGPLVAYATARDAYIDTLWEVEGEGSYHARVSVDGQRRGSEAVLRQMLPDGRGVPLNENGLVSTFKEAVARVFPSRRQVLVSAFAAQNRAGGFAALDQRGRLELFAEMLDLKHLEEMGATAHRCAQACERARTSLLAAGDALATESSDERLRAASARTLDIRLELQATEAGRPELETRVASAQAQRVECAEAAERHAVATAEAQAVQRTVSGLRAALDQADRDQEAAVRHASQDRAQVAQRWTQACAAVADRRKAEQDALAALRMDREERIAGNRTLASRTGEIRAAAQRLRADRTAAEVSRTEERRLADRLDTLRQELEAARTALRETMDAREELERGKVQTAIIATVPFGDKCAEAQCQFLGLATAAQARVPALTAVLADSDARLATTTRLDTEFREASLQLGRARTATRDLEARIARNKDAAYEPELAHAEERIAQYRADIAAAEAETARRSTDMDVEVALAGVALEHERAAIDARLEERMNAIVSGRLATQTSLQAAEAALGIAQEQVARTATARTALDRADQALQAAQAARAAHAADVARLEATHAEALRYEASLEEMRARLQALRGRQRQAEDEWLVWRLLAQALGRDGLPKLEIDAAGPGISQLVGQLLAVGYGARFTVDLTTQVARADGKGLKEEFAIRIFDNEHGGERDLSDLSGGERVVVEEALRAGILLFNNARQRRPIRTCWRDETTGALDPENRPRYVAMLRRMHALGGFRHTLFVTHDEALAELADAVLRVRAGVPTLERAA